MRSLAVLLGAVYLSAGCSALKVQRVARATPTPSGIPPPCSYTSFAVPNGDFEDGFTGWTVDQVLGSSAQIVSPGSNGGGHAAQLFHTRGTDSPFLFSSKWKTCPERRYELGFDFMVPETTPDCSLHFGSNWGTTNMLYFKLDQRPWTHKTIPFASIAYPYESFEFQIHCATSTPRNATVLVDNFTVTQVPGTTEPSGCPRAGISIANGDFETGTFANWTSLSEAKQNLNFSVVPGGYGPTSKYMFQADVRPYAPSDYPTRFWAYHSIRNNCEGYNYTYSFDYRLQGYDVVNYPDYCSLSYINEDCWPDVLNFNTTTTNLTLTDDWTHQEISCNSAQSGVNQAQFVLSCGGNGTGPVYNFTQFSWNLDNFQVQYDPPPS